MVAFIFLLYVIPLEHIRHMLCNELLSKTLEIYTDSWYQKIYNRGKKNAYTGDISVFWSVNGKLNTFYHRQLLCFPVVRWPFWNFSYVKMCVNFNKSKVERLFICFILSFSLYNIQKIYDQESYYPIKP